MSDIKIYLAPMEGVTDAPMRHVLTTYGNYNDCTSEFIRVTDIPLPKKTFIREVPEIIEGCKTKAGTNIRIQLLGDNKEAMLLSAKAAVSLGANYIDINFGCPSRFVHHSGSMLLREPELLQSIVATMREGLDSSIKVSVKIRTGFEDKKECERIIRAVALDGIEEITIHARTRKDLYNKEALDWGVIANMHEFANNIPLVANGDIVGQESFALCKEITKCSRFMIGRAALMVPNMGHVLKENVNPFDNVQIVKVIYEFLNLLISLNFQEKSILDRTKQFFGYARINNPALAEIFKMYCKHSELKEAIDFLEKIISN